MDKSNARKETKKTDLCLKKNFNFGTLKNKLYALKALWISQTFYV